MKKKSAAKKPFLFALINKVSYYNVLFLLASLLLIVSLIFLGGYILGLNDSRRDYTGPAITPTDTPLTYKASAEITPLPPDESSWNQFTIDLHYHSFQMSLPPDFMQIYDKDGVSKFQNTSGYLIIIYPASMYKKVKIMTIQVGGFNTNYSDILTGTVTNENATVDLGNEDGVFEFSGNNVHYFYFRNILNSIVFSSKTPDYPVTPKIIQTQLYTLTYPSDFISDLLLQNTTNCNNNPESLINLKNGGNVITIDMNKCGNMLSYPIKKAVLITLNDTPYVQVTYTDNTVCFLNPKSQDLKYLILYPLDKWPFAPKDTQINNMQTRMCLTTDPSNTKLHTQVIENAFTSVVKSLSID